MRLQPLKEEKSLFIGQEGTASLIKGQTDNLAVLCCILLHTSALWENWGLLISETALLISPPSSPVLID